MSILGIVLLLLRPAGALPACKTVEPSLDGQRIVASEGVLRFHRTEAEDRPTFADATALGPGFPEGFAVCWVDPRLRAYDERTLASLVAAESYGFSAGRALDGVLLDPLARPAAVMRHGKKLYLSISPALDPASALRDLDGAQAVARACAAALADADPGWSRVRYSRGRCSAQPFSLEIGGGVARVPSSAQKALALGHLRRTIPESDIPPGRFRTYCFTEDAGEYERMDPPDDWTQDFAVQNCVVFNNNGGRPRQVTFDDPDDLIDMISFVRAERSYLNHGP